VLVYSTKDETEKLQESFKKSLKSFGSFKKAITFVAPLKGKQFWPKGEEKKRR